MNTTTINSSDSMNWRHKLTCVVTLALTLTVVTAALAAGVLLAGGLLLGAGLIALATQRRTTVNAPV